MQYKQLVLSVLFLLGHGLTRLQAQESINTTGNNTSGNGGSVSYSIGQIGYKTYTGITGSLAQGVQQPYEICVVSAIEDTKGIYLSVYPNPTDDFLQLTIDSEDLRDLSYQLYDINGRLIQNARITDKQTYIVLSNLEISIYFMKVVQENNELKIFKIIKN